MKTRKTIFLTALVLLSIALIGSVSPTFGRQVTFNGWVWKHWPVEKIRF